MDDVEAATETFCESIETFIGQQVGGRFRFTQEDSVQALRDIETWCRDRRIEIQGEIDGG